MFYDPLQERLRKMEKMNPSLNDYRQSFGKSLSDRIYFLDRYFKKDVKKKLTWSDLGISQAMVDEIEEFHSMLKKVPQELVERVISDYTKP